MKQNIILILIITFFSIIGKGQELSKEFHSKNRERVLRQMPESSIALFFTSPHVVKSNDILFDYNPSTNFYYLTGIKEPNSVLILSKDYKGKTGEVIFVQERNPTEEIWDGKRLGLKGVQEKLDIENVLSNSTFSDYSINYSSYANIYIDAVEENVKDNPQDRGDLASMLKHFKLDTKSFKDKVSSFFLKEVMAKLRQVKSYEEINLIKKACNITCEAHAELMRTIKVGMSEFQAQSIVEFVFGFLGAEKKAFPSICGSGNNSCILHYSTNRGKTKNGDLMLVDIGAEYGGYAADVTRTFPVNGKFTKEQLQIYNIVLRAQRYGIRKCRQGKKFSEPHEECLRIIKEELKKLGIIKESKDVYKYYMHGTSHYMGLDVHDAGLFGSFKRGNIVTVEPGIYIPIGSDCDPKWWGIGIRIEVDILITKEGSENLTEKVTKLPSEIEELMKEESKFFKTSLF